MKQTLRSESTQERKKAIYRRRLLYGTVGLLSCIPLLPATSVVRLVPEDSHKTEYRTIENAATTRTFWSTLKDWWNDVTVVNTTVKRDNVATVTNLSCTATSDEIRGTVFEDFNYNGQCDTEETNGIAGVVVTLTDANAQQVTTTTGTDGSYSFTGLAAQTYRLEFNNLPAAIHPTFSGSDNGTSVQFVQPGNCANLGVASPLDYCQTNPDYFTTCFVPFDPFTGSFADDPMGAVSTTNINENTKQNVRFEPPTRATGATYGVAWQPTSRSLFVSSYMKQTAGFGPDGNGGTTTGGIYRIVADNNGDPAVSLFADLESIGTGNDPHPAPTDVCNSVALGNSNDACWLHDLNAFGKVGKLSFGDLELTPDGKHLITINLNERTLVKIPLGNDTRNPVAGTPIEYPLNSLFNTCADNSDWRPFALGRKNGKMYLGAVCSAESTQAVTDLQGLVYEFDPDNPTSFQLIFSFPLDYEREGVIRSCTPPCKSYWQPWTDVEAEMSFHLRTSGSGTKKADGIEPMPMLSDIEFFGNDLIIGIRDRAADLLGDDAGSPFDYNSDRLYSEVGAGDVLRAARNPDGSFTLENNGVSGNYTSAGAYPGGSAPGNINSGPGGKEFYSEGFGTHAELPFGGLAQQRGSEILLTTSLNPFPPTVSSGGVAGYNNIDGRRVSGNVYYDRNDNHDFGKVNGLGDLELMCNAAPLQIGNYVWEDVNLNGVQDAGEPALAGVRMELYDANETLLAFVDTDVAGQYYFAGDGADAANWQVAAAQVEPHTLYYLVAGGNGQFNNAELTLNSTTYYLTTANNVNNEKLDSDGVIADNSTPNFAGKPFVALTTNEAGMVDQTADYGFHSCEIPTVTSTQNCSDNGTNGDSTDDYYTLSITANRSGITGSNQYQVFNGNEQLGTAASYGSTVVLEWADAAMTQRFKADNTTTYTLDIRDVDDFSCAVTITTTSEAPCSNCTHPICLPITLTKRLGGN